MLCLPLPFRAVLSVTCHIYTSLTGCTERWHPCLGLYLECREVPKWWYHGQRADSCRQWCILKSQNVVCMEPCSSSCMRKVAYATFDSISRGEHTTLDDTASPSLRPLPADQVRGWGGGDPRDTTFQNIYCLPRHLHMHPIQFGRFSS